MSIVYIAIDGVGLGHLMRLSAIGVEVSQRAPGVPQHLITATGWQAFLSRLPFSVTQVPNDERAPSGVLDRRFTTLPREQHVRLLDGMIGALEPGLVVMDTHPSLGLLRALRRRKIGTALVLRELKPAAMTALSESGALAAVDELWIPHDLHEIDASLPPHLAALLRPSARVHWTGPVVFPADIGQRAVDRVSARHRIAPDDRVVVAAFGGGGYAPAHRAHLANVWRALERVAAADPKVRAIAIAGPLDKDDDGNAARRVSGARFSVVADEIDMQALLMRADAFVSHGGYNTVVEVLRTGVPAALTSVSRKNENQGVRVDRLAHSGRVERLTLDSGVDDIVSALTRLLRAPRPARVEVGGGGIAAQRALARLASRRPILVHDDDSLARAKLQAARPAALRGGPVFVQRAAATLAPAAPATTVLEIHIDKARAADAAAIAAACRDALGRTEGAPPSAPSVTLMLFGVETASLDTVASALRDEPRVEALVSVTDEGDDDVRFRALEACRLLELPFIVDVTAARLPRAVREALTPPRR